MLVKLQPKRKQVQLLNQHLSKNLEKLTLAILMLICLGSTRTLAAILTNWQFDPATNQLELRLQEGTIPDYFLLQNPPRIVVDLPNTQLGQVDTVANYPGVVSQVRVSNFEQGTTRIILNLVPGVLLSSQQIQLLQLGTAAGEDRWVLRPLVAQTNNYSNLTNTSANTFPDTPGEVMVNLPPQNPASRAVHRFVIPPLQVTPPATIAHPNGENNALLSTPTPVINFGQPLPK